jgi:predicted nucleic acid-binding protein
MNARRFFDTNILIYAFAAGDPKGAIAEALLAGGGAVSVQVLNEFANVSRRKLGLEWDEIGERLSVVKALVETPAPVMIDTHEAALGIARSRKLGIYDSLIVAAALALKCDVLLSEDLQHGAKFGKLEIQNPFAAE